MESGEEDLDSNESENILIEEIIEEDYVELPTDPTFGLTDLQLNTLKGGEERLKYVYENDIVASLTIENLEQTARLKSIESKSKLKGKYSTRRISKIRKGFNAVCRVIEAFDFFGVRPNLAIGQHGSTFVGFCWMLVILGLSLLTVALTLQNANSRQIMIDNNFQDAADFDYTLVTGKSLKFAMCFGSASRLKGSGRDANLRFFTDTKSKGRRYF